MSDVGSEARKIGEQRTKVNVALWSDQQTETDTPRCRTCVDHQKLKLVGTNWVCRQCGVETPVAEVKHEKKLTSKFPNSGGGNPIIMSQKSEKRKRFASYDSPNSELSEEDKQDLRQAGIMV
jgi:ribosomal protein L37AE/L43A